mmetsp:Transcript_96016/g.167594  ORF Transcript_96016/g.167594 Transcript_96016/m.167594 type:complete len:86 (-) Transcript_96016:134-391(-)
MSKGSANASELFNLLSLALHIESNVRDLVINAEFVESTEVRNRLALDILARFLKERRILTLILSIRPTVGARLTRIETRDTRESR